MSEYEGKDPLDIARQAEKDLASRENNPSRANQPQFDTCIYLLSFFKRLTNKGLAQDSGVDENIADKFPGASVTVGSAASGAGDNREIPVEEGGDIDARGRVTKAKDFEGEGGPETKAERYAEENPGADDIRSNIR
jgi:hypothetical protein